MKKGRLLIFGSLLISSLSLSGCLTFFYKNEPVIEVDPPTIDVVSNLKLNLKGKKEKTLFPVLSDSSVKNPVFNFASSNSDVASVSSDGVVTGKTIGSCAITVTLQSNPAVQSTVSVSVVDEDVGFYDYTLMFYMCGSDLEFYSDNTPANEQWFFTKDIQEMMSVHNIPDSVRIIIETGGTKKWNMSSNN